MNNYNNIIMKCYNITKYVLYFFLNRLDKINIFFIENIDVFLDKIIYFIFYNIIIKILFIPLIIFIKILNSISILIENKIIHHYISSNNDIDNMEWINIFLSKCWKEIALYLSIKATVKFESLFINSKPIFLKSIDIITINLGSIPINILNVSTIHDNLDNDNYIHLVIDYEWNSNLESSLLIQDYFHTTLSIHVNNLYSKGTFHAILGMYIYLSY
jgi:Ca2+-dependent lipid-binding protein